VTSFTPYRSWSPKMSSKVSIDVRKWATDQILTASTSWRLRVLSKVDRPGNLFRPFRTVGDPVNKSAGNRPHTVATKARQAVD
jgi:hypothetical protein